MDELTKEEADLSLFSICCICWSSRYCQANTHLYSSNDENSSEWHQISCMSCQFPGQSSTLTCSCKYSRVPSGKPYPRSVHAAWKTPSPKVDLMPVCHILNTNTSDELSSQANSNDASQLGCFLFFTLMRTPTNDEVEIFVQLQAWALVWFTGTWLNGFQYWTEAQGGYRVFMMDGWWD